MLYQEARTNQLATSGPYARVRHPQYDGFLLIMIGFLLQWPTIPTLLMFPVLALVYPWLAGSEEREEAARFGDRPATPRSRRRSYPATRRPRPSQPQQRRYR